MNQHQTPDVIIDLTGLACPMPLLKTKQQLNKMTPGQILRVMTSDPGSVRDFQSFTRLSDNEMLELTEKEDSFEFLLKKG